MAEFLTRNGVDPASAVGRVSIRPGPDGTATVQWDGGSVNVPHDDAMQLSEDMGKASPIIDQNWR